MILVLHFLKYLFLFVADVGRKLNSIFFHERVRPAPRSRFHLLAEMSVLILNHWNCHFHSIPTKWLRRLKLSRFACWSLLFFAMYANNQFFKRTNALGIQKITIQLPMTFIPLNFRWNDYAAWQDLSKCRCLIWIDWLFFTGWIRYMYHK